VPWNAERAASYGIPGVLVEDNDAIAVHEAAGEERGRQKGSP